MGEAGRDRDRRIFGVLFREKLGNAAYPVPPPEN